MTLPTMTKLDWYDTAKRRAVLEAAIALVNEALPRGTKAIAEAYRALGPLLERELEDGTFVHDATDAAWKDALGRIHEAHYGFAPTRATREQLKSAVPEVEEPRLGSLVGLAGDAAEYADGATLAQIANLVVKQAKAQGVAVTRAEARRIVAALEGAPIPPR